MPKFCSQVSHQLTRKEAQSKLQSFSEHIRESYQGQLTDMEESWDESGNLCFAFKVMGLKIDGKMEVSDSHATVNGTIPFAAVVFKGEIEKQISNELNRALTS